MMMIVLSASKGVNILVNRLHLIRPYLTKASGALL